MNPVGVGLIGCGNAGQIHAEALASLDEGRLTTICDEDPYRARDLANRWGVPKMTTHSRELLDDPETEAVLVCTPHPTHSRLVLQAAERGVHALVEKPLGATFKAADLSVKAADRAGIRLAVIHQRRWFEAAQRLKAAVEAGKFGEILLADCVEFTWRGRDYFSRDAWRGRWDTEGGGVLVNQTIHYLDLLLWFVGVPVETVFGAWATLAHPYLEVDDAAVAVLRFQGGALGTVLTTSATQALDVVRVGIHGSNGAAANVVFSGPDANTHEFWNIPGEEDVANWRPENAPQYPRYHRLQIQDFLCAIREERPPAVTGEDGRRAVELLTAIYRANATGLPVQLPLAS
jgi:predicted dehydrogenase